MTQLLPPVGLHAEIIEVFENGGARPADELMAMLNTPARIQRRGFPVRAEHLLAVVIDTWGSTMTSRRTFYKTTIVVEVLSEKPFEFENLNQVAYEIVEGGCSGQARVTGTEDFQGPRAAKELIAQGSDPAFFRLDSEGNDIEAD